MNQFKSVVYWTLGLVLLTASIGAQEQGQVESDSVVTLEYVLKLSDETVVAGTESGEPVTFQLGQGQMFLAVESKLIGMQPGETQEIVLSPQEAFGESNPEAIQKLENSEIPEEYREVGRAITVQDSQGAEHRGIVVDVSEQLTTIDFNHPLAGRTLHMVVRLLQIKG